MIPPKETSEILGVAVQTLALWRMTGKHGLPFVKVGRQIRYRVDDIDTWLSERRGTNSRAISRAISA
jgi:excisionase family DNA binding protein